jgi:hypothetical protein
MSILERINKGPIKKPARLLVYGPPGVGKTTFASEADKPLIVDAERRSEHLNVERIQVASWPEIGEVLFDLIKLAKSGKLEYKTIVLDTADHIEQFIYDHICKQEGVEHIELVGGGFGKGLVAALQRWKQLVLALDTLRDCGVTTVILCHSTVRTYMNPLGIDYDRYQLKLDRRAIGYLTERMDLVGFAHFKDFVKEEKYKTKAKGITGSQRVLTFGHSAAFDSKLGIPMKHEINLCWKELKEALDV